MNSSTINVHGAVAPGFERIAHEFVANFTARGELGAAVTAYVEGRKVADLWGGIADARTGQPWTGDTSAVVFSCTKGLVALCVHRLAQAGRVDLDAPICQYWPEFAANGKEAITVRCALSHRAGLMALDRTLTRREILGWTAVIEAIEAQAPLWKPGVAFAYHPVTYGHIAGELIRRVTGLGPRAYFATEIAAPLGISTSIGLPEDRQDAVARIEPPLPDTDPGRAQAFREWFSSGDLPARAASLGSLPLYDSDGTPLNDADMRAAELPAVNGITTARDLAKLYAAVVTDLEQPRLLSPTALKDALAEQSAGPPWTGPSTYVGLRWGTGFMLDSPPIRPLLGPASFGHDGAGGQLGFADHELRVGFGYVNNQMGGIPDERAKRLTAALALCIGLPAERLAVRT